MQPISALPRLRLGLVSVLSLVLLLLSACTNDFAQMPIMLQTATQAAADAAHLPETSGLPVVDSGSDLGAENLDTVRYYTETVTLPTYPYERYQTDAIDPQYNWPYKVFDVDRFRAEAPTAELRDYRVIVLENAYLKVLILPELGGRIWQVIHKPSGAPMFYQNDVVKPTHWGIENQRGWLGLGGLEWSLPVIEHGYDWGSAWDASVAQPSKEIAYVTLSTPPDGRYLQAKITVSLRAGMATFEVQPTLTNISAKVLDFSFWQAAMLAPGSGQRPSSELHFVLPADKMTIHSTANAILPQPGETFAWPVYKDRDWSRLGHWQQYVGFFEAPAAHGPFVGVYDPAYDAGAVRIFPADIARGSKVFALGWSDTLASYNFADDDSRYVELHGGLAPTFADQYRLPASGSITWDESWYPVQGMGDLTFADGVAALDVQQRPAGLRVAFYPTRPLNGELVVLIDGKAVTRRVVKVTPAAPFNDLLLTGAKPVGEWAIQFQDRTGHVLFTYPIQ
jgi:hypothetical protein